MFYFAMKQPVDESSSTQVVGNFSHVPVWANNQVYTDCSGVKSDFTAQDNKVISKLYYNNDQYRPYMQIYKDEGQTATFSANYPTKLFWSQQEQESEDIVPIPTKKIEGKWQIKNTVHPFNYPAFCGCELNFILQDRNGNNKQCHYITGVPVVSGKFNYFINTENTSYGNDLYPNALYGEGIVDTVCDVSFVTDSYNATSAADLVNHVEHLTTLGSIQGQYHGNYIIIDTPQDIPEIIYNYIEKIATFIPEKKVVIKSADAKTTRTTIKIDYDAHGIKINRDTANPNAVVCKIETIAPGLYFSGSWRPIKPAEYEEDLQFVGLVNNPNQRKPDYTIGGTGYQDFTFSGDEKILYECWNYPKPQPTGNLTLVCYENKAEKNKLDKSKDLVVKLTMTGTLRSECDILNPVIEFTYTGTQIPSFNYVGIDYFRRYYFVDKMDIVRTGLYRLTLSVDELYTYKDEILTRFARVERSNITPYTGELVLQDPLTVYSQNEREIIEIPPTRTFFDFLSPYTADAINKYAYDIKLFSPFRSMTLVGGYFTRNCTSSYHAFITEKDIREISTYFLSKTGILDTLKKYFVNTPLDGILSLRLYPLELSEYFGVAEDNLKQTLAIGDKILYDKETTEEGQTIYHDVKGVVGLASIEGHSRRLWAEFDLDQSVILRNLNNENLNCGISLQIWLPFVGQTTIPIQRLASVRYGFLTPKRTLKVFTTLDIETGKITYEGLIYVGQSSDPFYGAPLFVEEAQIGMDIPLQKIDYDNFVSTVLSTIGNSVSAITSLNPHSIISTGVNNQIALMQNSPLNGNISSVGQKYTGSTFACWCNKENMEPKITISNPAIRRIADASIEGIYLNKVLPLSECKGPSKVSTVHLENMGSSITKTEIENIERKLKEGFIA